MGSCTAPARAVKVTLTYGDNCPHCLGLGGFWDAELSVLRRGQSQANRDGGSPYPAPTPPSAFLFPALPGHDPEPRLPVPRVSGLGGGHWEGHPHPALPGLLPLSEWSEWSPCGPCLPPSALASASRTALEERWLQDPTSLSPTSAPLLASEQHRHRLCLDPVTGRPWTGAPHLCTAPLHQQRLCPDPGACPGNGERQRPQDRRGLECGLGEPCGRG